MVDYGVIGAGSRTFGQRMVAAAKLDTSLYNEVEADSSATGQAAGVVLLVALSSALGGIGGGGASIVGGAIAALLGWLVWAGVTYLIGDKMLGGTATWGELLRTLGFAQSAGVLYIFAAIPLFGWIVRAVLMVWILFAGIIAIREALDFSTGKALLTAIVGWFAVAILMVLLAIPAALAS